MIARMVLLATATTLLLSGCALVTRTVTMGLDGDPVACVTLQVSPEDGAPVPDAVLQATGDVMVHRLAALGARSTSLFVNHTDQQLVVGLPAGDHPRWQDAMTQVGRLTFVAIPPDLDALVVDGQPLPPEVDARPMFDGGGMVSASLAADELGRPAILLTLAPDAAARFDAHAAGHFGERFAIVLDGIVMTAPSINARRFDGEAQISGSFTVKAAEDLTAVFDSGPLPVPVVAIGVAKPVDGGC